MEQPSKIGYIYLYQFLNGKGYVGQTVSPVKYRFSAHVSEATNTPEIGCVALNHAINRYGAHTIVITIVWTGDATLLNAKEVEYIALHNTLVPNGYNISPGGQNKQDFNNPVVLDKMSQVRRVNNDYDLPRGIIEINNPGEGKFGFRVQYNGSMTDYTSKNATMEEKLARAKEVLTLLRNGGSLSSKKGLDHLGRKLPNHIGPLYYRGTKVIRGYIVRKPKAGQSISITDDNLDWALSVARDTAGIEFD